MEVTAYLEQMVTFNKFLVLWSHWLVSLLLTHCRRGDWNQECLEDTCKDYIFSVRHSWLTWPLYSRTELYYKWVTRTIQVYMFRVQKLVGSAALVAWRGLRFLRSTWGITNDVKLVWINYRVCMLNHLFLFMAMVEFPSGEEPIYMGHFGVHEFVAQVLWPDLSVFFFLVWYE